LARRGGGGFCIIEFLLQFTFGSKPVIEFVAADTAPLFPYLTGAACDILIGAVSRKDGFHIHNGKFNLLKFLCL